MAVQRAALGVAHEACLRATSRCGAGSTARGNYNILGLSHEPLLSTNT